MARNQWLRLYTAIVDNPKIQLLPDALFRLTINLWCLAKENDGYLPAVEHCAFRLRLKPDVFKKRFNGVSSLFDVTEDGRLKPHDWDEHQYESDVSRDRMKRLRQRQSDGVSDGASDADEPSRRTSPRRPQKPEPEAESEARSRSQPSVNGSSNPGGWPLTRAWLAEAGARTKLVEELISIALRELPSITDEDLRNSLIAARKPNQRSPGLFRQTLPELIREYVRRFKAAGGELP